MTVRDLRPRVSIKSRLQTDQGEANVPLYYAANGQISLGGIAHWDDHLREARNETTYAWNVLSDYQNRDHRSVAFMAAWRAACGGDARKGDGRCGCVMPQLRGIAKDNCCIHMLRAQDRGETLDRAQLLQLGAHIKTRANDLLKMAKLDASISVKTPFVLLENDRADSRWLDEHMRLGDRKLQIGRRWFRDVFLSGNALVATEGSDQLRFVTGINTDSSGCVSLRILGYDHGVIPTEKGGNGRYRGYFRETWILADYCTPVSQEAIKRGTKHHARGW